MFVDNFKIIGADGAGVFDLYRPDTDKNTGSTDYTALRGGVTETCAVSDAGSSNELSYKGMQRIFQFQANVPLNAGHYIHFENFDASETTTAKPFVFDGEATTAIELMIDGSLQNDSSGYLGVDKSQISSDHISYLAGKDTVKSKAFNLYFRTFTTSQAVATAQTYKVLCSASVSSDKPSGDFAPGTITSVDKYYDAFNAVDDGH